MCGKNQVRILRLGIREDPTAPVYECGYCGLVYIDQRFPDLREYYRSQYRQLHVPSPTKSMTMDERFFFNKKQMAVPAKAFMAEVPEGAMVLEVGCGTGGFLAHLQGKYDLYASEWNPTDAEYVRAVGGIPCEEGDVTEVFPGKKFTAIVLLQVLEHQPDPLAFLRACRERLIGGGWLYIEVPNLRDALLSQYQLKAYADFWFREPHLTYWKAETIAALVNTLGLEARINWRQRYSLHNHVNWILNGVPMEDANKAIATLQPVDKRLPGAAALNRIWAQISQEYRIQVETLMCADTLIVNARRIQI